MYVTQLYHEAQHINFAQRCMFKVFRELKRFNHEIVIFLKKMSR
jgi:hypothetical protein